MDKCAVFSLLRALGVISLLVGCSGGSLQIDGPEEATSEQLVTGSGWQIVPIASIPTAGSCTSSCVNALNSDNGSYLRWIACSNGNNTRTEYTNPTDFRFNVTDPQTVTEAVVRFDGYGSSSSAAATVECVNGAGQTIATILPPVTFPTTARTYEWSVPLSCLTSSPATIRFRRTSSNCLAADVVALIVRRRIDAGIDAGTTDGPVADGPVADGPVADAPVADAPVADGSVDAPISDGPSVDAGTTDAAPTATLYNIPIASIPTSGSCTSACVPGLNTDDGTYLRWLACANGTNTTTEYTSPTSLVFAVPPKSAVTQSSFVLDAFGSGSSATMRIECVNGAGTVLGTLYNSSTSFSTTAKVYEWPVPLTCFGESNVIVRITRTGSNCLGVDFARLKVTSTEPPPAPPPPPPPGIIINDHTIEGYTDKISVVPGEQLAFKVHSPQPTFSIEFARYGLQKEVLLQVNDIPGQKQDYPETAYRNGAGWATSYTLTVPSTWATGMYSARLFTSTGHQFYVTFIVREPVLGQVSKLAVLASTNTWQAYNSWGGGSYYSCSAFDCNGASFVSLVNMARPNVVADPSGQTGHTASGEQNILRWLEREGYRYSMLTDWDLHHKPSVLAPFKAVLLNTHTEYWSKEMYDALEAYMKGGGNLLYLSGNGIYWKVTISGDQIEVRKNGGTHVQTGERGGLWRDLGRPEARLLGVAYTGVGANTSAPYRVSTPTHWVFAGTGVASGTLIGSSGVNIFGGGASGWETDKVVSGTTPSNRVLLAKGTNANSGGADMLYYDHSGGGGVFSVGSINFGGSLIVDATLTRVIRNVLDRYGIAHP